MSSTFDRFRQPALVFCACSGLPTRSDFTVIRRESGQRVNVFIINFQIWVSAESTLSAVVETSVCHNTLLLICCCLKWKLVFFVDGFCLLIICLGRAA